MRVLIAAILLVTFSLSCHAAETAAGRWQGSAQIPGRTLEMTVDLDRNAQGAWIGSIIIPELNISGAPLADIAAPGTRVAFAIKNALGEPGAGQAQFKAQIDPGGSMAGTYSQAGNSTTFSMKRTGAAQVELPIGSTAIAAEFAGKWLGEYEISGVPRHVTLNLVNHADAVATAEFVIVGKKTNEVPVDLVRQDDALVRVHSSVFGINYEGRLHKETGEIIGTFEQGPFELPLNLRRAN